MTLEGDQVLAVIVGIGGSWSAVGILGWWLSGQFRKVEQTAAAALASHEKLDNERHEQSLMNFGRVYVALARKGFPVVLEGSTMIDPPIG